MFKLKRETDLGLLFLEALAGLERQQYLSLQTWAGRRRLPYRFLTKVAAQLKQAGYIISKEGKSGGYRLAKPQRQINLGRVIRLLEGSMALTRCSTGAKCSCRDICRHRGLINRLGRTLEQELSRVSLQSVYARG